MNEWKPKKVKRFEWIGTPRCYGSTFGVFCYYCDEVIINCNSDWLNDQLKNYRLFRDWHKKEGICSSCRGILRWKI